MKFQLYLLLAFFFSSVACKKERITDVNPVRNGTGHLLSDIVFNYNVVSDTMHFKYNNRNQLSKLTLGSFTICDSFDYNQNDQLIACRYRYRSNVDSPFSNIVCSYRGDTIIRSETTTSGNFFIEPRKYTLLNDKIVKCQFGSVYRDVTTFANSNLPSFTYKDTNLVKCISEYATLSYQPIDTFAYNKQFKNPYLLLGKHVWTLITNHYRYGNLVFGESVNLPSVESYAEYGFSGSVLTSSRLRTYKTSVVESAEENKVLPKITKRVDDMGVETIIKFIYIKEK